MEPEKKIHMQIEERCENEDNAPSENETKHRFYLGEKKESKKARMSGRCVSHECYAKNNINSTTRK